MIDKIFLTLFLEGGELPDPLPPIFEENLASCRRVHPGAEIKIYSLNEARAFLVQHFDADVRWAFDALSPFAYKSDLMRYALMYLYGGLYADVSLRWIRPLPVTEHTQLIAFKDLGTSIAWGVNQALIYTKPGRREFLDAIRGVVANVRAKYYGVNSLCPTGPTLYGRVLATAGRIHDYTFGWHRYLTPGEGLGAPAFILGDELIALKFKHQHGDISSLGFVGANSYILAWETRRAYGETGSQWRFSDHDIGCEGAVRREDGIAFSPQHAGVQTYGPYCRLSPGVYDIRLSFASPGFAGRLGVDVTAEIAQRTLMPYRTFVREDLDGLTLKFSLVVDTSASQVEIRTYSDSDLNGMLLAIGVEAAPG